MEEGNYSYTVKIPENRIAVVIGKKGETKEHLEKVSDTSLDIDSEEGIVTIEGDSTPQLYQMQSVIKAIGRGFNPKLAQLLLKQDFLLEVLDISKVVGEKDNQLERAKGRVIGKNGKARRTLEKKSDTFISVYGKTISIIGTMERVNAVKESIMALLEGAMHGPVYEKLQSKIKEIRKKELMS